MSASLTEQDLLNIKQTVLTLERQEIARNIDPRRFFGHLRAKYVFDERDCDEIRAIPSRICSAELFVDVLKRKGAHGYDEFCNALMKDQTQMFLLQRMTQTLELLRAKVIERKQAMKLTAAQLYPAQVGIAPQGRLHFPPPYRNPIHPNVVPNDFQYFPGHSGTQHPPQPRYPSSVHKPLRKVNSRHSDSDINTSEPNNSFNNPTIIIPEEQPPMHHIYHPTNVMTLQPPPPTGHTSVGMYQPPPISQPHYVHNNPWLPSESMNMGGMTVSGNYSPVESGPLCQRLVCRCPDEQVVENTT